MAINWGSIFGSGNYQGRFGVEFAFTAASETIYEVVATLYYQTRYKVIDSSNNFWVDWDSYADTAIGAKSINHPSNSSWSSSNITKIGSWKGSFRRTDVNQTGYFSARCSGIEYGGNGSSYFTFTIPKIPTPEIQTYTIAYDDNGGSGGPPNQIKVKGTDLILSNTIPVRPGYIFEGWGTSADDTTVDYAAGGTYSKNASITLYAIWKERKNLIHIHDDGTWNKGTVHFEGANGTHYINVNGTWRKGGA